MRARACNLAGMTVDVAAIKQRIGERVLQFREAAGLTQALLAEKANMSETYVCLIENGHCNPSLEKLCELARALAVEFEDLTKA